MNRRTFIRAGRTLADALAAARLPRRRRVHYVGWTGYGNLGDEAVYEAVSSLLPGASFVPVDILKHHGRVLGDLLKGLLPSCCLGGGTLIHTRHASEVRWALDRGVPVFAFGTGVRDPDFWGDNDDSCNVAAWTGLLDRFMAVGVRGVLSRQLLIARGVPEDRVSVVGDPALHFRQARPTKRLHRRILGVNFGGTRNLCWGGSDGANRDLFAAFLGAVLAEGWTVRLFCVWEDDFSAVRELQAALRPRTAEVVPFTLRPRRFVELASGCDVFVGLKLHSAVLAHCSYTPAILVGYRPKCLDYMLTMGLQRWHVRCDEADPTALSEMVDALYGELDEHQEMLYERCSRFDRELRRYAAHIWGALSEMVGRGDT